ncbi:MAG: acetolactate synthase, partial [Clostridiales bacterium]|nr:acetolactate synthase [Clostridiales bacterium]
MHVKQISVFIENSTGKLADITRLLANNGIDLMCMS